jgi:hypothetical protein
MSIFHLHSTVLADYRDFVGSFFTVADERAERFIERALYEEQALFCRSWMIYCAGPLPRGE